MTDSTVKLRALWLSALMVFSVFAGVTTLGGTALGATTTSGNVAVGNAPSVDVADATIDPSSDSNVSVALNVSESGLLPNQILLRSFNDTGSRQRLNSQLASNAGFSSNASTGNVTIPVNSQNVTDDFTLNVTAYDNTTSTPTPIAGAGNTSNITVDPETFINGTVTDANGNPVTTTVEFEFAGDPRNTNRGIEPTDASGFYSYQVPNASKAYEVIINDPNYVLKIESPVSVTRGQTNVTNLTLVEGGFVNGTVTNASDVPLKDIRVNVQPRGGGDLVGTDTTNSSGHYSVRATGGKYEAIITNNSYQLEIKRVSVTNDTTTTADFSLTPVPDKGFINGTLTDSDGNAVANRRLTALDINGKYFDTSLTDQNGEFSLSVPASEYTVRARGSGTSPPKIRRGISVQAGETTDISLQYSETGFISGTVENASGGTVTKGVVLADGGNQVFPSDLSQGTQGSYNISVPPGDYTVSVFSPGQSGDSKDVTVTAGSETQANFTLRNSTVVHSSVEVLNDSSVQSSNIGILASVQNGIMQVQLTNQSRKGGAGPPELEGLGVDDSTEFRMNFTVTNFSATSLIWGIRDARWNATENSSLTNATDITVRGKAVNMQVNLTEGGGANTKLGPLIGKDSSQVSFPEGNRATNGRNKTMLFGIYDLANLRGPLQKDLNGLSVTTNAQRFEYPNVANQSLEVWTGAPSKTEAGDDHTGFYQVNVPDSQLSKWNVDDPENELNVTVDGESREATISETSNGARIVVDNINYSTNDLSVNANPETSPSSPSPSPSPSGGSDGAGAGGVGTGPATTVTTRQTDTGTEATIEQVTLDDPTVTVSTTGTSAGGVSVTEVSATFNKGTNSQSTMSITASSSPPSGTPDPPNVQNVLSYVEVTVEGSLAKSVSEGRFTVDVSGAGVDPADVTAQRYDGNEWEDVETEPVGESTVEIVSPEGYSAFAVSASESAEPEQPTATPTAVETDTPADTPAETPATGETSATEDTPAETATPTPTASTGATPAQTATPTATSGAFGPGFGVVAALLAIVAALGALRLRRP